MVGKAIKYFRLKNNLTIRELASKIKVTPMAISNYERDARKPDIKTLNSLATALGIKVSDFLDDNGKTLKFEHGEFRKNVRLTKNRQEYIQEAVEEYFGRFYKIIKILGKEILGEPPKMHVIPLVENSELNAKELKKYLEITVRGPIENIVELLESKGILIVYLDIEDEDFSGINGSVNERPYIAINQNMTAERIRSTLIHEVAHFAFNWSNSMPEKQIEKQATAISGSFLFSYEDAIHELGNKRTKITKDMLQVCRKYGISMFLLVKRANLCNIITDGLAKNFFIKASKAGWRKAEPERIIKERPNLFANLVYRAVCENEITLQKGAELLKVPCDKLKKECCEIEG